MKNYMIFASNVKEVKCLMAQIEAKGFADYFDIRNLAGYGMPIWCCLKDHQFKYIEFELLEREFEKFANQRRFTFLRERFFEKLRIEQDRAAIEEAVLSAVQTVLERMVNLTSKVAKSVLSFFKRIGEIV